MTETTHDPEPTKNEFEIVRDWRLEQALLEGVSVEAAEKFAEGDGDLSRLRNLVKSGCAPDVAARAA